MVERLPTMLHAVALAWQATLGTEATGGDAAARPTGAPGPLDTPTAGVLRVEPLLEAFRVAVTIAESFGPLMAPAVQNDLANAEKVRRSWSSAGKPASIGELLRAEVATGVHKPGTAKKAPVLKDPSAAIALVWVRRSLAFQLALLEGVERRQPDALPPPPRCGASDRSVALLQRTPPLRRLLHHRPL